MQSERSSQRSYLSPLHSVTLQVKPQDVAPDSAKPKKDSSIKCAFRSLKSLHKQFTPSIQPSLVKCLVSWCAAFNFRFQRNSPGGQT
jgi:hypothetical protein